MIQELRNTHLAESLNFNLLLKKILFFPRCLCTLGGKFLPKLSIKCEQPQPRASACLSIFKSILQTVQRGNVITYLLYRFTFNRNYFFRKWIGICDYTTYSSKIWVVLPASARSSFVEGYTREEWFAFANAIAAHLEQIDVITALVKVFFSNFGNSAKVNMFSPTLRW